MEKEEINELEMKLITASKKVIEKNTLEILDINPEMVILYKYNSKKDAKLNIKIYYDKKRGETNILEFYLNENGAVQFVNEQFHNRDFAQEISSQYSKELKLH